MIRYIISFKIYKGAPVAPVAKAVEGTSGGDLKD